MAWKTRHVSTLWTMDVSCSVKNNYCHLQRWYCVSPSRVEIQHASDCLSDTSFTWALHNFTSVFHGMAAWRAQRHVTVFTICVCYDSLFRCIWSTLVLWLSWEPRSCLDKSLGWSFTGETMGKWETIEGRTLTWLSHISRLCHSQSQSVALSIPQRLYILALLEYLPELV